MQVSNVDNTSFGKLYLSSDKDTRAVIKEFVVDKDSVDTFRKSLEKLDIISEDYSMELSAEKEQYKYMFYLNKKEPDRGCAIALPIAYTKTSLGKKHQFSKAMNGLITACENIVSKLKNRADEDDLDALFAQYKK